MSELNKELSGALQLLNQELKKIGLLQLDIVNPNDCIPQKMNARYFKAEVMNQLISNIKKTKALESVPLVYKSKTDEGKYHIISGHHRIDAAKAANLQYIMVMVTEIQSADEKVSKQLSHNALVGEDDKVILSDLFQSIEDISWKIATGLNDAVSKISISSLNFRVGDFKEFTILFLPEDMEQFDKAMEDIAAETKVGSRSTVRLSSLEYYDKFASIIRKVKKVENIKSTGTALMRLIELAQEKLKENDTVSVKESA